MRNEESVPFRSFAAMAIAQVTWIIGTVLVTYEIAGTHPALGAGAAILLAVIGLRVCWG